MEQWQLQDAKAHLSELVRRAAQGPQLISVRGRPAAVLLSPEEYERLRAGPRPDLVTFLRESPLAGLDLVLEREQTPTREDAS